MEIFIFDVDGTITEPRQKITPEMNETISRFLYPETPVYLTTGSNHEKTVEQCGSLAFRVDGVFACSGNAFYMGGERIFMNNWVPPQNVINWLKSEVAKSPYPTKTGNHIEIRPGSLNFSVVGRNADPSQRIEYRDYDFEHQERMKLVTKFTKKFPHLSAKIGGDTGIDIAPLGNDKSQVYKYLCPLLALLDVSVIRFFGDRMDPGGNDEPLATILSSSYYCVKLYPVKGPADTLAILQQAPQINEKF
jgi:phosphomannomutase